MIMCQVMWPLQNALVKNYLYQTGLSAIQKSHLLPPPFLKCTFLDFITPLCFENQN